MHRLRSTRSAARRFRGLQIYCGRVRVDLQHGDEPIQWLGRHVLLQPWRSLTQYHSSPTPPIPELNDNSSTLRRIVRIWPVFWRLHAGRTYSHRFQTRRESSTTLCEAAHDVYLQEWGALTHGNTIRVPMNAFLLQHVESLSIEHAGESKHPHYFVCSKVWEMAQPWWTNSRGHLHHWRNKDADKFDISSCHSPLWAICESRRINLLQGLLS